MDIFGFAILLFCALLAIVTLSAVISVSKKPVWAQSRRPATMAAPAAQLPVAAAAKTTAANASATADDRAAA